ncbi:Ada metal-binding domain-containing protein [Rhizobacter sp. SG703]|uniref:DNA-3-methyladenine glycosylase 2 family protein n=1 Tax=Rhizobacter sp. SG703 TaxID=2587140 RepID=UPI00144663F8|nr:Ada metal-binding domain-containing protein [Rhizobacter sp. SG703]NKI93532.1 AraC family transcriptional regulator of adaptative response / DNA-3-methyladenine glycosylase II [Rhizobacter sp. SG703]
MPSFDSDAAYLAIKARDARFDGQWFVGVTSTGIYCRPICRVRTPRRENCVFFDTPAQAEAARFRPCMKCRPEVAPGPGLAWTVMDASRTLARQAAHWLDHAAAEEETPSIAALAAHLGVSDRHLRRIFAAEHGVTPLQYVQTRRLLLAKQLLTDTRLPVAQVALASGFRSLRRFNAAFADSYRMSPTRLRGDADGRADPLSPDDGVTVSLGFRSPYDTAAMLRFLTARAVPGVEAVEAARVRRSVRAGVLGPEAGWLEASFIDETPTRPASLRLRYAATLAPHSGRVVMAVRRWLDLDAAPQTIDDALRDLPGAPGLRLPGSIDAFEMAVRAVLGQQVTVAAARTLARRLIERFGEPLATPWNDIARGFPSPAVLAAAPLEHIAELGIIRTRVGAIQALANAWPELTRLLALPHRPEALMTALAALPGIGPWTAHYLAMRALGWPDAFPPKDVAVLNAMKTLFGTQNQREADARAEAWRPWRSYAVLRLWNSLAPLPPDATPSTPPASGATR